MAVMGANGGRKISRGLQLALFLTAMAWAGAAVFLAGRSAQGIVGRLQWGTLEGLIQSGFLLFLLVTGYRALDWIAVRGWDEAEVLALPRRTGWVSEWGVGAAVGWALCLAAALPVVLSGHMHSHVRLGMRTAAPVAVTLMTLLVSALAGEVMFRGYPFRRLTAAVGPASAAVLLSVGFGLVVVAANPPRHTMLALVDGTVFGLLLAMAYLRTHALWVGWGLHFAYRAVTAVVLGLPIAGHGEFGSVADTYVSGPRWLSGGAFGLDAAFLTAFVMLGGMVVLYRVTREYAWRYTHAPILAAGYEVTVTPPAAHAALEKAAAAAPPPLVQILPAEPQAGPRASGAEIGTAGDPVSHG